MRTAKAKSGRRQWRHSLSLSDRSEPRLSPYAGPWMQSRPRASYEDAFWPLARFARMNQLSMHDAFRICHAQPPGNSERGDARDTSDYLKNLFKPRYLWREKETRFCPICAESGWIPDLYSLPILISCPFHNAQLTSACCACGYALKASDVRTSPRPFLCRSCGLPWCGASHWREDEMSAEWPPEHEGGASRMAIVEKAALSLSNLRLTAPQSFNQRPRREGSEFILSLWGFACSLTTGTREPLAAITVGAALRNDYALAFRKRREVDQRFAVNDSMAQLRIKQYLQLRSEVGTHFGARSWPTGTRARKRRLLRTVAPWLRGDEASMGLAFMRWRGRFEGMQFRFLNDEAFKLRDDDIWDQRVFYKSTVVGDDWIPYCVISLFEELDGCLTNSSIDQFQPVRRECGLAGKELSCGTVIRVISEGRWPFLDDIVTAHALRVPSRDAWRLVNESKRDWGR
jgi:hypothetical protein